MNFPKGTFSNLFNVDRPRWGNAVLDPMRREIQVQLIIRALGGDGTEQGLVPADSIREKALRLLYALEEVAIQ